jgi:uncharacterized SAM-binding protein YcdF (DUF218 family)
MRRLILIAAAAVLLAAGGLGWGFAGFLDLAQAEPEAPAQPTGAIVVLTGGAERVETALRLLDQDLAPLLLVSGAHATLTLAELARAHGRDPAALAARVRLGRAAATTIGNAAEAAAFARAHGIASLRLVTAGYHMPRAMLEFGRAMPGITLLAHPVQPAALRPAGAAPALPATRRWGLLFGEYVKYVTAAAGISRFVPARESARR